jgi:hypothetical protein
MRELQAAGATSLAAGAAGLNARRVRPRRGDVWHASTVRNVLRRASQRETA